MSDPAKCLDCGGDLYVNQPVRLGMETTAGQDELTPASDRPRVGVCGACEQGWLQSEGSDSWTRVDRVGFRHP